MAGKEKYRHTVLLAIRDVVQAGHYYYYYEESQFQLQPGHKQLGAKYYLDHLLEQFLKCYSDLLAYQRLRMNLSMEEVTYAAMKKRGSMHRRRGFQYPPKSYLQQPHV